MYVCTRVYMYVRMYALVYCTYVFYHFTVPGEVGMVNLTCGAMDLINLCHAAWNVSV